VFPARQIRNHVEIGSVEKECPLGKRRSPSGPMQPSKRLKCRLAAVI
jgi:hypothetical protein